MSKMNSAVRDDCREGVLDMRVNNIEAMVVDRLGRWRGEVIKQSNVETFQFHPTKSTSGNDGASKTRLTTQPPASRSSLQVWAEEYGRRFVCC